MKNSSLRTNVTAGWSASHDGFGESVTMKIRRTHGAKRYTERSAYLSSSIWRKRASESSPSPTTTSFMRSARRFWNSGSLPSTQEKTMSMSKVMSDACASNMPRSVFHSWPYISTVAGTTSAAGRISRVSEFSTGQTMVSPSKRKNCSSTAVDAP